MATHVSLIIINVFYRHVRFLLLLLAYIEQLDDCQKLHTLILQDNVIDSISNIEWCRELWIIDLSGNRVREVRWREGGRGGRNRINFRFFRLKVFKDYQDSQPLAR